MKSPFSFDKLIRMCEGLIPDDDLEILKNISLETADVPHDRLPAVKRWRAFETALRNELAKIRAHRRHTDAHKYLRQDGYADPSIVHAAFNAHRNPSIIEAEKMLDQERWRLLDEISIGHYFDIDVMVAYAYKLRILERWDRVRTADKQNLLKGALEKVQAKI